MARVNIQAPASAGFELTIDSHVVGVINVTSCSTIIRVIGTALKLESRATIVIFFIYSDLDHSLKPVN
jgi:hypothetical protein